MNRRGWIAMACAFIVTLTPRVASAQSSSTTQSNVPVLASGQLPTATPGEDEKLTNVFQGSVMVGSYFDDNAVLGAAPRQWDLAYIISPSLSFRETLPRLDWGLTYTPGFIKSQNVSYRNQFTQNFGGNFTWRVSRHGTLSAQQDYLRSNNPFQQLATNPGPTVTPNQTIFLPSVRQTSILSNALYSYQFSERSSFGVGGSFNSQHFDTTPRAGPTRSLIYAQVVSGKAYYSHQLSARNQLGFEYDGKVLRFPAANARTTTHTFLVFEELQLTPNTNLTLYGGPQYALTSNQVELNLGFILITIPIKANQWNGSGGVIYSWTGQRLAVVLNYSRGISDGGGLVGAVKLNAGTADFTWKLTKRWRMTSSLAGADDQLLAAQQNSQNELRTYSASLGLARQLSKNVSINMSYERLNQTGGFAAFPVGNHDLADVSITYSFMKPLGR